MKVTPVSIKETQSSIKEGCPALTPELLAATGARYSRCNEGLYTIIEKINPNNMDASVDSIFKMIDYGHQSIADMVPVAMFIDDISLFLAYYVWTLCPVVGGQESSTRYIQLNEEGLISAELLGIPEQQRQQWQQAMQKSFAAYKEALQDWNEIAIKFPERLRIPQELLKDENPKTKQKVARMIRNYNFDRARYYIPVAASTNMMMVMSARAWVTLCQNLCSHYLPEAVLLGKTIANHLQITAPRMTKHAKTTESFTAGILQEFQECVEMAQHKSCLNKLEADVNPYLDILEVKKYSKDYAKNLECHHNRYDWFGSSIRRTGVRFGYEAVAFAEIRDLNRHRTGTKYCPLVPQGFYDAEDEFPMEKVSTELKTRFLARRDFARQMYLEYVELLKNNNYFYIYWTMLGTQYPFEHITTADKFLYEAELRTGLGSHYRYAKHLADSLDLWKIHFPETKDCIKAGMAEPE